jgi:hypothetical protein
MPLPEYRFTNDLDVVARLDTTSLQALIDEFPAHQFYVNEIGAHHAAFQGGQFNIIHPDSGLKVDVIVPREPDWPDQLARRVRLPTAGNRDIWFVSPEDLILRKMDFYRQGESEKHLRDIASMLKIKRVPIDLDYISTWAARLGLHEIWRLILVRVS